MTVHKKIRVIGSMLLAVLVMVSSFGYTLVVHSCSMSGHQTIYINKTDTSKACTDCCSDTKETAKSIVEEDCCKDQSYSHVLLIEASTIELLLAASKSIAIKSFVPLHFLHARPQPLLAFFAHTPQSTRLLALSRPSVPAYVQEACKLQI